MIKNNYQSLRSSCDRCRFHKLKCTMDQEQAHNNAPTCTRCIRAKFDCVFSRRARPGRQSSIASPNANTLEMPSSNFIDTTTLDDTTSASHESNTGYNPLYVTAIHYPDYWIDPFESSTQSLEINTYLCPTTDAQISQMLDANIMSSILHQQDVTNMTPPLVTDNNNIDLYPDYLLDATESSELDSSGCYISVQLSILLKETHEALVSLQNGPLESSLATSVTLDQYPIGAILHLSQTFSSIIRSLSNSQHYGQYESSKPSSEKNVSASSSMVNFPNIPLTPPKSSTGSPREDEGTLDSLMVFLVLCCYISLMKLQCVVFTHFSHWLTASPKVSDGEAMLGTRSCGLQLGQSPSTDMTSSKIHTATRMLLESFEEIEFLLNPDKSAQFGGYKQHHPQFQDSEELYRDFGPESTQLGMLRAALNETIGITSGNETGIACGGPIRQRFISQSRRLESLKDQLRQKLFL